MKDKIIKALKCISGEDVYCEECSYSALYRYNFCIKRCAKDAIDLINRFKRQCNKYRNKVQTQAGELRRLYKQNAEYKAEIKSLTEKLEALGDPLQDAQYKIAEQQAEIARLNKEANKQQLRRQMYRSTVDEIKAEAIKEFWEKAKQTREFRTQPYVYIVDGDNLVKEMVGDVE